MCVWSTTPLFQWTPSISTKIRFSKSLWGYITHAGINTITFKNFNNIFYRYITPETTFPSNLSRNSETLISRKTSNYRYKSADITKIRTIATSFLKFFKNIYLSKPLYQASSQ